ALRRPADLLQHIARESGFIAKRIGGQVHAAAWRRKHAELRLQLVDPFQDSGDDPSIEHWQESLLLQEREEHSRRLHVLLFLAEPDQYLPVATFLLRIQRGDRLEEED